MRIDILEKLLPKKYSVMLKFFKYHQKIINWNNPKTLNEKIQFRKFFGNNEYLSNFADKYTMRKYIKETFGEKYLVPLIDVKEKLEIEDFNKYPQKFVIKTSHGSGKKFMDIIYNKSNSDFLSIKNKFNNAIKIDQGKNIGERFYSIQPPKILIEKLLLTEKGEIPKDYKFHCLKKNGKLNIFIKVDISRFGNQSYKIYNEKWEEQNFQMSRKRVEPYIGKIPKPENLDEMLDISKKISETFDYVRIDFYEVENNIYIGELTFAPASGYARFKPKRWDYTLGDLWEIEYWNEKLYYSNNPLNKKN